MIVISSESQDFRANREKPPNCGYLKKHYDVINLGISNMAAPIWAIIHLLHVLRMRERMLEISRTSRLTPNLTRTA